MKEINNINDAKIALKDARSFADICAVFNNLFYGSYTNAFTENAICEYVQLTETCSKLIENWENISKVELFDLKLLYDKVTGNNVIYNEFQNNNPEFNDIINAANKVRIDDLEKDMTKNGEDFAKAAIWQSSMTQFYIDEVNVTASMLKSKKDELKADKFADIRQYCCDKVKEELENNQKFISLLKNLKNYKYIGGINDIITRVIYSEDQYSIWKLTYDEKDVGREVLDMMLSCKEKFCQEAESQFPDYQQIRSEIRENEHRLKRLGDSFMSIVSEAISNASGITQEEAIEWAENNVYMDKAVENKLANIGYSKENLIKDIAEVYRYVGGKLGPVEFIATRGNRAFAKIDNLQIAVDSDFNKKTLFHECGHLVETLDKSALTCSLQFLYRRSNGAKLVSLNKLSNCKYAKNEKAYPDNFIDVYVGKNYGAYASEVYSMALQQMSSPESLAEFMKKDIDHFNLFLGQCLHKSQELQYLTKKYQDVAKANHIKAQTYSDRKKAWENSIKKAMPREFFEETLKQSGGYENLKIETWGDKAALYLVNSDGTVKTLGVDKKTKILKIAYLHIAAKRGLLPNECPKYYANSSSSVKSCHDIFARYCDGDIPDWFDPQNGLPKIQL